MGKWTDKLYITHSEWTGEVGQHSASSGTLGRKKSEGFKRLPFYCCSLSLQPFEHPVCTKEGIIFDLVNIVPYIKKYGQNPVTGEPLTTKDLITLHFFKNDKGEYHCPITFKVFSSHTAIAAIKSSGNVFAHDTIERLNIKPKHWHDLLNDEPFTKKDIIMLQDPHNLERQNMEKFHYVKNKRKVVNEEEEREKNKPINNINVQGLGGTASRIFAELQSKEDTKKESAKTSPSASPAPTQAVAKSGAAKSTGSTKARVPYNAAHFTTGAAAEAFTSTVPAPVTVNERALIDEDEYMYDYIKKKGYARIVTNFGNLNIELYCDKAPRTCHNFVLLAKSEYYNGVSFHRNIPGFMIQGGDPTGTGRGGESHWGKPFPDELKFNLSHNERGVLSMANKGKNTNGSQFFITYDACKHLDRKHTIFGRVVGGMDVLDKMEAVEPDAQERPKREIRMKQVVVFVDPFEEYKERLEKRLEREQNAGEVDAERKAAKAQRDRLSWFGQRVESKRKHDASQGSSSGVGKYLKQAQGNNTPDTSSSSSSPPSSLPPAKKPKPTPTKGYGNFDNF